MDPMDIDDVIDVLDTPNRAATRVSHGVTHAEDENHSPIPYTPQNNISQDGSRDHPVIIDSGSSMSGIGSINAFRGDNKNHEKSGECVILPNDSVASADNNNGFTASSPPPIPVDFSELVAEGNDSTYTRKGKGVMTHPCSSKELDSKNKNLQRRPGRSDKGASASNGDNEGTVMKRQKQGSTSSTCGQCFTSVSDDEEVVSLNPPAEAAYSRSTSGNAGIIDQIIEVDEVSPRLRRDDYVRARQLEADERLARELQEQFYNEAPVLGAGEVDEPIGQSSQHQDGSDNEVDQAIHPVLNDRVVIPRMCRRPQTRASSYMLRMGSPARSSSLDRMTSRMGRFRQAEASLVSVNMRMQMLDAWGDLNAAGLSVGILRVPRNYNNVNDYETLLALDDNNDQHSGVSAHLIDGLPQSTVESEDYDETCVVCLETPTVGEAIRSLPCLHKFHKECIDPWLRRRNSCPVCKASAT